MRRVRVFRVLGAAAASVALIGALATPASAHEGHVPGDGSSTATGAVITETGVVVAVNSALNGGWLVTTPCLNEAFVTNGTFVPHVDIVLDPGHGGSESGSVSGSVIEKHVNLDIARRTEAILEARGYTVQLTRTRDDRVPLRGRTAIANALDPDLFISIHHNGGATRFQSTPGTETFYQAGDPESRRFAQLAYERIKGALAAHGSSFVDTVREGANNRTRSDGTDLYGVLRNSPTLHSVILEALYLSNAPEAAMLTRDEVKDAEAVAIADSVDAWYAATGSAAPDNGSFVDESTSGTGGTSGCVDPELGFAAFAVTGYTEEEFLDMGSAANYLGYDHSEFQKAGVVVVDFIRRISNLPDSEPLSPEDVPELNTEFGVPTEWNAADAASLNRIASTYEVTYEEAQKIGASLLVFLVGLDKQRRGIS